jgi:hypothetical protein
MTAEHTGRVSKVVLASVAGIVGTILSFVIVELLLLVALVTWFKIKDPNDPSASDAAGWAFIFTAPIHVLLTIWLSIYIGIFMYKKIAPRR